MPTLGRPKKYDAELKTNFTEQQIKAIDKIAKRKGVNRSEVVRRAVDSLVFTMDAGQQ